MLVNAKNLLKKASAGRYAVGAFNVYNIETIKAVLSAAEKAKSPVILQTSSSAISYASLAVLAETMKIAARSSRVPVVLHLDHGRDIRLIKKCLKAGYNSVMLDGSALPFGKNANKTKQAAVLAHKYHASAEGEIGTIGGKEDSANNEIQFTNPEQAELFAAKTGIDSLAVGIGTSHGIFKPQSGHLRLDILKEIKKIVNVPLVLHGASLIEKKDIKKARQYGAEIKRSLGVPKAEIKKAIKLGISKINVDTDLRIIFSGAMREFYSKHPDDINPRDALAYAEEEIEKSVIEHMKLFGSVGKANTR